MDGPGQARPCCWNEQPSKQAYLSPSFVMAALVPAIHVLNDAKNSNDVDARYKAEDDGETKSWRVK